MNAPFLAVRLLWLLNQRYSIGLVGGRGMFRNTFSTFRKTLFGDQRTMSFVLGDMSAFLNDSIASHDSTKWRNAIYNILCVR